MRAWLVPDDHESLDEKVIAERAAILCDAAEQECRKFPGRPRLVYVVGTEVPPPGGEVAEGHRPATTSFGDVQRSLEEFRKAFYSRGLAEAWERVIAIVVQPGVEFGDAEVFDYDRSETTSLSEGPPSSALMVYEAHSTDYQTPDNLAHMVEDHFAILKVGPWLTFAYREAVFRLSAMERELLEGRRGVRLSRVREALEAEMLRDPGYWQSYYRGNEQELHFARAYSYSDRCRYYWPRADVQEEVDLLFRNLGENTPPLTLLSQFVPAAYEAIRRAEILNSPQAITRHCIQRVLRHYAAACGAAL